MLNLNQQSISNIFNGLHQNVEHAFVERPQFLIGNLLNAEPPPALIESTGNSGCENTMFNQIVLNNQQERELHGPKLPNDQDVPRKTITALKSGTKN